MTLCRYVLAPLLAGWLPQCLLIPKLLPWKFRLDDIGQTDQFLTSRNTTIKCSRLWGGSTRTLGPFCGGGLVPLMAVLLGDGLPHYIY